MVLGKIKQVSISDPEYPEALKKISTAPSVLYYIGKMARKEKCLAMVGTRRFSSYGKQTASWFAGRMAEAGATIVSGLAPGIDTFCHEEAVKRNRRTIAVIGTGLSDNCFYPKENLELAKKIIESGGCLISEYPPETRGTRFTFPQRNRIISGLSEAVLVIEAPVKSGAMITAAYALSQKRKLLALPGSIYYLNSQGPNYLIKKGAKLVDSPEDILYELELSPEYMEETAKDNAKKEGGASDENLVLSLLREPLHIDRIIEELKMPAPKTIGLLSILEIKGKIKNIGENTFKKI